MLQKLKCRSCGEYCVGENLSEQQDHVPLDLYFCSYSDSNGRPGYINPDGDADDIALRTEHRDCLAVRQEDQI